MARVTVEDGLKKVPNKFELVKLATKRARQLIEGAQPLLKSDDREVVLALIEIAVPLLLTGKERNDSEI